jgi:hypothetical protein
VGHVKVIASCCMCGRDYVVSQYIGRDSIDRDIVTRLGLCNNKKYTCPECIEAERKRIEDVRTGLLQHGLHGRDEAVSR